MKGLDDKLRWIAFAAVGLGLAAIGAVAILQERDDDRDQTVVREFRESWRLVEVSADGRALKLFYNGGGCATGKGRAIVQEAKSWVRIRVLQGHTVGAKPASELLCTLELTVETVVAHLRQPVLGRRIEGDGLISPRATWSRLQRRGDGYVVAGVPRVVGLSVGDAVELLGYQLLRARLRGSPVGRVIAQRPKPGAPVRFTSFERPAAARVTLTLGRFRKP